MTTTTTGSTRALEIWSEAQKLRVALIARPTAAVPPCSLGGLDHVRRLAEGLAERGHQVTLIGAGLGGLVGAGYSVIDTDPVGGQRASAEIVERLHAERAGKVLELLGGVDVVSDHTRQGSGVLSVCPVGALTHDGVEQARTSGIMRSSNTPDHHGGPCLLF